MVKLERRGKHVCSTESWHILGHCPASVPSALLDTGSGSTVLESQESPEEIQTNGKLSGINKRLV